jgi:hypothetical protein
MKKQVTMAMVLALAAVFSLTKAAGAEPPRFVYEDLGYLGGDNSQLIYLDVLMGINDNGQLAGTTATTSGYRAFVKTPGHVMVPLGSPGITSGAADINNYGIIVGAVGPVAMNWEPSLGGYSQKLLGHNAQETYMAMKINDSNVRAINNELSLTVDDPVLYKYLGTNYYHFTAYCLSSNSYGIIYLNI